MKNYKEINEIFEVSEDVKKKTIMKLQNAQQQNRSHKIVYGLASVCILLLILVPLYSSTKQTLDTTTMEKALPMELESKPSLASFIHEDLAFDLGDITKTGDIAGELEPINNEMLEKVKQDLPTISQLKIPDGFDLQLEIKQYIYRGNHIGPYVFATYKTKQDDLYHMNILFSDKRIPECTIYEPKLLDTYGPYQLNITKVLDQKDMVQFIVKIYDSGNYDYAIDINCTMKSEEEFINFLESFLYKA